MLKLNFYSHILTKGFLFAVWSKLLLVLFYVGVFRRFRPDFATNKLPVVDSVNFALVAAKMSMTIKETVGRYEGPPRTNNACFLAQKKRIEVRVYLE